MRPSVNLTPTGNIISASYKPYCSSTKCRFAQLHREPGLKNIELNDLLVHRCLSFLAVEGKRCIKCVGSKTVSPFDNF